MVGVGRIELPTPAMSTQCSTTELYARGHPAWESLEPRSPALARGLEPPGQHYVAEHPLDLQHQVLEVERLGQHLGLRRLAVGLQRDRGEAGDEQDLHRRADFGAAL